MKLNSKAFDLLWKGLPSEIKEGIETKAEREHMSLSDVMREDWPELWMLVILKVRVKAKCVACGEEREIQTGEIAQGDTPMCAQCGSPMVAVQASRK